MRQLSDSLAFVKLTQDYEPYGKVSSSSGAGSTAYGFAGEWADTTGLIHLRARYYASGVGRFVSKDMWPRDYRRPLSHNGWLYAEDNPINLTDPSGHDPWLCEGRIDAPACTQAHLSSQTAPWSALTPQQQQLVRIGVFVLEQWAKNHQAQVQLQNTVRAFAHGVVFQFLDDESLGLTSTLDPVSAQDTDPAFVTGRHFGRGFSTAFSALEIGIGGGCGLGGAASAPTGVGLVVLGSGAVLLIGHGGVVIVRNATVPIPLPNFSMASTSYRDRFYKEYPEAPKGSDIQIHHSAGRQLIPYIFPPGCALHDPALNRQLMPDICGGCL
jgi:RHS repeat-associated protein